MKIKTKICGRCKKKKYFYHFGVDSKKPDGRNVICKMCANVRCAVGRGHSEEVAVKMQEERAKRV